MTGSKSAGNIMLYTLGEMIPRVLSFLLLPVLTRYLTPIDYGISSYITTVASFLFVLTSLSVNTYALRGYYKIPSEENKKKLLGNLFIFLNAWALIMLLAEIILFPFLLRVFSVEVPFYPFFFIGLVINFFDVSAIIPLIYFRVKENAKAFVLLSVGRTVLQYLLVILFVVFFKQGLYGSFMGRLIACIPFGVLYFFIIRKIGIFHFDLEQVKNALIFSLPLLPGVISYLVVTIFDRVILERYVSLNELGIYSIASTLALALNIMVQGLYRTFEQRIFKEHNSEGYAELADKLYKIYITTLSIAGFCMVLFSKEILLLFTSPQYYASEKYMVYLVIAVIISGINTFFTTLLIADNKRRVVTFSSVAGGIISFITNLLLIKYFFTMGACIALILSFLTVYMFYINKVKLLHKYVLPQLSLVILFFCAAYLIPSSLSIVEDVVIKCLVMSLFVIYVLWIFRINLSFLSLSLLGTPKKGNKYPGISCCMIENFTDLWKIILSTGCILLVLLFLFRKHIVHILDPLLFYIITQAFTIELAFLVLDNTSYLINFLACQVSFFIGFFLCAGKGITKTEINNARLFHTGSSTEISFIKWFAVLSTIVLIMANAVQMKLTGIVLFSDNPSATKVTSFTEGTGIIKRLNWGMLYVSGIFLMVMFLLRKQAKYAFLFCFILVIPALGGSKGALLFFVLLIALLSCFGHIKNDKLFKKIRVGGFILLGIAIVLAGIIIRYSNSVESYEGILFSLVARFLFYGDSMMFYYNKPVIDYFSGYNIIDYFTDDFNSVFGLLRLTPYTEQLGYRLVNYYFNINSETWGPSIPFYIKGNMYFGYYGSFIYSFVIGAIIGFVRSRFYKIVRQQSHSLIYSLIVIYVNMMIYTLAQDSPVFISVMFDTILLSLPVIAVVFFLHFPSKSKLSVS